MKLTTKFTTAASFYEKTNTYTAGQGTSISWTPYKEGSMSVFPCEWRGTHGNAQMNAQAVGVLDSARIRMPYIPDLYNKLRTAEMIIIKGADPNAVVIIETTDEQQHTTIEYLPNEQNPNVYTVWGGVDNMQEECRYMEFNVRRYEVTG